MTASEIARRLEIPQSTVVRILETLIAEGYVCRQAGTALLRGTAKTEFLSRGFDAEATLINLVEPVIEELRTEIG